MGNQMFQYAFGKQLAHKLNTELFLDLTLLLDRARGKDIVYRNYDLDIFNLDPKFLISPILLKNIYKVKLPAVGKLFRKIAARKYHYIREPHFHVNEQYIAEPKDNTIYEGWWQSEQYFSEVREEIKQEFSFKHPNLPLSENLFQKIEATNSVCLNVRRTDFLKVATLNTTTKTYFLNAVDLMANKVPSPHFFIFSDDIPWCRENLQLPYPFEVIGHEHKGQKFGNYLKLMKTCKHFIIPNSSFAWWAVWMNDQPDKIVIAPKNWFSEEDIDTSDLVPKSWIRI